jgi:hypothetical protein
MIRFYRTGKSVACSLLLLMAIFALAEGCATKEDFDTSLSEKLPAYEPPPADIAPFDRLADSPSCDIPVDNYLSVFTDTGGDLDDTKLYGVSYNSGSTEITGSNFSLGVDMSVNFYGTPKTGIYTSASSFGAAEVPLGQTVVIIINSPFNIYKSQPGQKVYVYVNPFTNGMTVKFCELKFKNLNPNPTFIMTCRIAT